MNACSKLTVGFFSSRPMKAKTIARALGGKKVGRGWMARCPAHDDRHPSLSIRDAGDKVLVHCHAGCQQRDVIDVLKARGLWPAKVHARGSNKRRQTFPVEQPDNRGTEQRTRLALSIWEASRPIDDTLVETYLASRKIIVCDDLRASDSLRFHPGLKHPDGQALPCMVGLFRNILTGDPCGIHRTFIPNAKKFGSPRMLGPSRGAAIMLSPNEDVEQGLGIAEGIETALSWYSRDRRPAWAVGSAGGIENFPILNGLECLTVYADNDESGRGEQAATLCCQRYSQAGIEAMYRMPATVATDWNDWRAA